MYPAVVVLADYAGTVNLSNRTEVRGRHTQGADPDPSLDLVDIPAARIDIRAHRWNYSLGYSAAIVLPAVQEELVPQVLQFGDVGATFQYRRVRIGLAEYGGYGEQNSAHLIQEPAPAGGPSAPPPSGGAGGPAPLLPNPAVLRFGSSRTVLTAELQLTRRWLGASSVEYGVAGGVDEDSRALLPFVRGPRAEARASFSATRLDSLETRASVLRTDTSTAPCSAAVRDAAPGASCSPTAEAAQLTESWQRRLTRRAQLSVGAGASVVGVRLLPEDPFVEKVFPVALASFQHERQRNLPTSLRLEAQVGPLLDVRTGIVDELAQATLDSRLTIRPVTLIFTLGATHSLGSQFVEAAGSLQGSFEAEYRVDDYVSLGTGVRYAWQEQGGVQTFSGGSAFAQVTLRAPPARF
jgi:hypothetical protein